MREAFASFQFRSGDFQRATRAAAQSAERLRAAMAEAQARGAYVPTAGILRALKGETGATLWDRTLAIHRRLLAPDGRHLTAAGRAVLDAELQRREARHAR